MSPNVKPNFTLDFRNDQIALLHLQTGGDWLLIGAVAVDDPDLDAAMGYLRATALGLSPRGIATKLILPNDAILLTTLSDLSGHTAVRRAQIASALVGRTPYDVIDLAYDWTDDGTDAHLAVIARETLAEAEAFATQHRFNPIVFAAFPENGLFEGEAGFGPTALAASILADTAAVDRDADTSKPAEIEQGASGAELPAAHDFQMGEDVDDGASVAAMPVDVAETAPIELLELPVMEMPAAVPSDTDLEISALGTAAAADTQSHADDWAFDEMLKLDVGNGAASDPELGPEFEDAEMQSSDVADLGDLARLDAETAPVADSGNDVAPEIVAPEVIAENESADADETNAPVDVPASEPVAEPLDAAEIAPIAEELDLDASPDEAPMALDVPEDEGAEIAPPEAPAANPSVSKAESLLAAFAARRALAMGSADAAPRIEPVLSAAKTPAVAANQIVPPLPAEIADVTSKVDSEVVPESGFVDVPFASDDAAPASVAPKPVQSPVLAAPKQLKLATKPSKIKKPRPPVKSRSPLLGFILTAVLLIALAAAAAMSSYITAAWNSYDAPVLASVEPSTQDEAAADGEESLIAVPETSPEPLPAAASGTPAALTTLASRAGTALPVVPDALPEPALTPPVGQIVAAAAPPDTAPDPALAPLIIPTAQGVLTPEGVLLIAGKPKLVPTPRTEAVLAAYAAKNPVVPSAVSGSVLAGKLPLPRPKSLEQTAPILDGALAANPALAGKKPLTRPADLAPVAAPAAAIPADPKLAGKRPAVRPENILAAGRSARLGSAAASLTAQAETAKAAEAALAAAGPRSPLAVAISRVPAPRPQGLRAAAEAAKLAALAKAPEPVPEVAPEITPAPPENVEPEADNEPEEPAQKSSGGARTVVSKQATYRNAINLSNVNLIGVYGSKSNRYALIRLASGRFKKLKVGDRFDGGQVAAITESEMRYSKGGQMVALKMPKG